MYNIRPLVLANSLHGFHVHATDGPAGRIDDFIFSDESWKIRHVVIDLGKWLPGRKVLLPPEILGQADWRKKFIEARIDGMMIQKSPDADTVLPEVVEKEREIFRAFAADPFEVEASWGIHQYVSVPAEGVKPDDQHLQSIRILKDCAIIDENHAYLGSVGDFLVDTDTWEIRFMFLKAISDSRIFIVSPSSVSAIDMERRKVYIRHPDDMKAEWQEYDPHYMAMLEMAEK